MPRTLDYSILEMALVGLRAEAQKIDDIMGNIRKEIGGRAAAGTISFPAGRAKPRRVLSPAARRRIAAAQKARWAAFRSGKSKPAKRTLSPAVKAKLVANLAKARAARAAKKAATG
jgi:hypothetical protein